MTVMSIEYPLFNRCRYSTLKLYTDEGMMPFGQTEEKMNRRFP